MAKEAMRLLCSSHRQSTQRQSFYWVMEGAQLGNRSHSLPYTKPVT